MLSPDVEISLNLAVSEAARRGHEFVTVEHILYALLHNRNAARAIRACGGSIETTRQSLDRFFEQHFPKQILKTGQMPQPTIGFQRVIQRALQNIRSAGKEKLRGENVLVAIFSERDSFAAYFLQDQQISRFDVINFVSHGIIKEGVDFPVDDDDEVGAEANDEDAGHRKPPENSRPRLSGGQNHLRSNRRSQNQDDEDGRNSPGSGQRGDSEGPEYGSEDGADDGNGEGDQQGDGAPGGQRRSTKGPLALYTVDLCERARDGSIDPLIGRGLELERTIQILCRRRKNNPLLVGDSGVGKTAIAEGLALRIVKDEVPSVLKDARIFSLDMGTLIAGSRFRGDFEQRLKSVLKALKKQPKAILFIDEIHTVIGAGSVSGGTLDASNLLKPALSAGELRCIGSTTFKEYRQHFEADHALARRFQKIDIEEPSNEETVEILKGLKRHYESFHNVRYSLDALKAAVDLSSKFIRDRKLPDKAIDVIDEAGAAQALKSGRSHFGDLGPSAEGAENAVTTNGSLPSTKQEAQKPKSISVADIQNVVAKMARIPATKVTTTDREALRNLASNLQKVVFGQDQAIEALASAIKLGRSGLGPQDRPIGSFLFTGPTGVGKTEVAKQLATILGIGFLRFDMSEYMERHTVSRLIGAPPGYVGFDQGGLLTDAVNKTPHAVLLLDEIEKAHPDVYNILLQVMDHGTLTDSNGRQSDFRNVVLVMTSNAGARELQQGAIGFTRRPGEAEQGESEAIKNAFSPEFRNRLDGLIKFQQLPMEVILMVVDKFLGELKSQLAEKKVILDITPAARNLIANKGFDPLYGARPLARYIQNEIKRKLADEVLFGQLVKGGTVSIDSKNDSLELKFQAKDAQVS